MTSHSIEGLSDGGLREQYARVIDPGVFHQIDSQAGFPPESLERYQERCVKDAFAKADAIIALSTAPERVEGGGMDSSSQSQTCAEKGPQPFSHDAPLSDGRSGA